MVPKGEQSMFLALLVLLIRCSLPPFPCPTPIISHWGQHHLAHPLRSMNGTAVRPINRRGRHKWPKTGQASRWWRRRRRGVVEPSSFLPPLRFLPITDTRGIILKGKISLSLCNLLHQIMLLYLIWKPSLSPFKWGMVALSAMRS